ncbi:MAG TPA: LytTR family transcriptional regulator DNA-binding domain-containing protein [Gemmatimonadaceae bacterium]|nr:LytTR family transcriptional regulator DNA-binding domain-containing protein [Gemmatimonadaceae bacterium]
MERNGASRASVRSSPAIRALLVDDEPLALRRLRRLLAGERDIQIVDECTEGRAAAEAIRRQTPDLVFLDIQIPELDGFQVLDSLVPEQLPVVVFVTAYDEHALRAFDAHALDYLLKPVGRDRFRESLDRARERVLERRAAGVVDARLLALHSERTATSDRTSARCLTRIAIKADGRAFFVRTEDVDWIEAADNYVRLHVGSASHLVRESLRVLETKLDPEAFLRVHRSAMVNIDAIRELQPWFHGDHVIILRSGARLTCSRRYDERLRQMLANDV